MAKLTLKQIEEMTKEDIWQYCADNDKMDWLEKEMAKTSIGKKDGKKRPITVMALKADFKRDICGIAPKPKKATMQEQFAAFKANLNK